MPHIVIYTKALCSYCLRAKKLLGAKGASFEEIPIDGDPGRRAEMIRLAGGARTVPQIFIKGRLVGGCDDLMALDEAGRLDVMLESSALESSALESSALESSALESSALESSA